MSKLALARARDRFLHSGVLPHDQPRPEVLASWLRCYERYAVDPARCLPDVQPPPADGSPASALRVIAEPLLRDLVAAVAASKHLLLLSDERGQMLYIDGYQPLVRLVAERNIVVGSLWHEAAAGTNGIGTALAQDSAFEVAQSEHFCEGWQDLTCTGAPIHHPIGGQAAGVIDITGRRTLPQPHTLALVETTARLIEREWSSQLLQRAWFVAEAFVAYAQRYAQQPVIAFDADGFIVQTTDAGAALLHVARPGGALAPLRVATETAQAVATVLHTLAPGDARACALALPLPGAARPVMASLLPVMRGGQALGAIALLAEEPAPAAASMWQPPARPAPCHRPLTRLAGTDGEGRLRVLDVHGVCFARADGRGVWLHTREGEVRSTYPTLRALAEALPAELFFQANRAELVNVGQIAAIEPDLQQSYDLVLHDPRGARIAVSRRRLSRLQELIHF